MTDERIFDPVPAMLTLAEVWRGGPQLTELPLSSRPQSLTEAYVLQRRLSEELGEIVVGYKLGLSSPAAMQRSGFGDPIMGFVPKSRLLRSGATIETPDFGQLLIEVEIAFELSDPHEISAASATQESASTAYLAFEVLRSRFAKPTEVGMPSFVGDASGMHAVVIGDAIPIADLPALLQRGTTLRRQGEVVADALPEPERPDPFDVLERFKRLTAIHAMPVRPGMFVATGSLIVPFSVNRSGVFEAAFGPYRVAVEISRTPSVLPGTIVEMG